MAKTGSISDKHTYADVDLTHKPSEVSDAIRVDILEKLIARRGQEFGDRDRALMLFHEVVSSAIAALQRGRDN